jgi:glycosyltransferase involved in cell wall biosynthesis
MRVVYVSYDGALDPLGASQVVPYLLGLSRNGFRISLISFEKPERWAQVGDREALERRLAAEGISWNPLRYHRNPRLPATLWDVFAGSWLVRALVRQTGAQIVHCRGDVATVMARWAALPGHVRILYDMRAFFSDQRAESGSWRRGGLVDRAVRRLEAGNLRRANGLVVLTDVVPGVLAARRPALPSLRVIPTCADLEVFHPRDPAAIPDFLVVFAGTLGTVYMAEEMVAFARSLTAVDGGRALFLTPQVDEARRAGAGPDWADVRSATPAEVPNWLRRARALFFFLRPTSSTRAACPTKLAEALATGLPVVANPGIGDLDAILERESVGVFVREFSRAAYEEAGARLRRLLQDPETTNRCRRLAETRYSLEAGVAAYRDLYQEIAPET